MRIERNNEDNKGSVFDKHFRELRNSEAEPPTDLWEKVEYKLDEERHRVKHDHWYHAILLLLIPLTLVNIYLTYDLKGVYVSFFNTNATEQTTSQRPLNENHQQRLSSKSTPLYNGYNGTSNETGPAGFSKTALPASGSSALNNFLVAENYSGASQRLAEAFPSDEIVSNDLIPVERLMQESSVTPQDVKFVKERNISERKNKSAIRGFHVGLETGLNNSMILLKENSLAPIVGSNIHHKMNLGGYYGISMGYDFSSRFGMEAEWILHSQQGEKYSELRYGKIHIDGQIDLEYMQVPVMFKYKMSKLGGKSLNPRVVNFVAGIQYSRLKEASVSLNDMDLKNATEPFNRNELGFLLGIEYDLFVKENYFLTLGTRASISSNMHAFPYFAPQASQSYNVLLGVNASFHYLMKRR